MNPNVRDLDVNLGLEGGNAVELDELTTRLREQLLELDVEAVDRVYTGPPPPGTRAVEIAALGALVVKLATSPQLLGVLVHTVQSWLGSHGDRSVHLKLGGDVLDLKGVTSAQQQQLIDDWVTRHSS